MIRTTNHAFRVKQVCPLQWLFVSILKLLKGTTVSISATETVQTPVYQNVNPSECARNWQSKCEECAGLLPNTAWSYKHAFPSLTSDRVENLVNVRHTRSISHSGCHVKQQHPLLAHHLHMYYHSSILGKMDVRPYNASIQCSKNTNHVFVKSEWSKEMWSPNYTVATLTEVRLTSDHIWKWHPQHILVKLLVLSQCLTQVKKICFHHNIVHIWLYKASKSYYNIYTMWVPDNKIR